MTSFERRAVVMQQWAAETKGAACAVFAGARRATATFAPTDGTDGRSFGLEFHGEHAQFRGYLRSEAWDLFDRLRASDPSAVMLAAPLESELVLARTEAK